MVPEYPAKRNRASQSNMKPGLFSNTVHTGQFLIEFTE